MNKVNDNNRMRVGRVFKKLGHYLSMLTLGLLVVSVAHSEVNSLSLIPKPQQVRLLNGETFTLSSDVVLHYENDVCKSSAELLAEVLRRSTGLPLPVKKGGGGPGCISFATLGSKGKGNAEGYTLTVNSQQVRIVAAQPGGLFYGGQTFLQLLPPQIYGEQQKGVKWQAQGVEITDEPKYPYRGLMLDVSRYFFDKRFMLRFIDMMAMHKLNTLQWHVVDDCGWRIEIKKYPKLTEIGAFRGEDKYGGFYTQEDIKEIVAYAAARNVTIIPEIEIPAHTLSAICAYPELGCTGKQHVVPDKHFISKDILCAGKDSTFEFIHGVLDEVCELFPGRYIHIGGDEVRYDRWEACEHCQKRMREHGLKTTKELQGWVTTEVEKYLKGKNRSILGWDEILGCGVSKDAGIMTWHRANTAREGAKRGNPVVLAYTGHCYFDTPESNLPGEPKAAKWIPPVSLFGAYNWDPIPKRMTGEATKNILGGQGCLWADQLVGRKDSQIRDVPGEKEKRSERYFEYLALPRSAALCEVTWTDKELRSFEDFQQRMKGMYARYAAADYNHRLPVPVIEIKDIGPELSILTPAPVAVHGGVLRYTLDGSSPTPSSAVLDRPIEIDKTKRFKVATFSPENKKSLDFSFMQNTLKFQEFGKQCGAWKSGEVGLEKPKRKSFDVTKHIDRNGEYELSFLWTHGAHGTMMENVELYQDDRKVAEDLHKGSAGKRSRKNQYTLIVDKHDPNARYTVTADMHNGPRRINANGVVFLIRKNTRK